jgi:hypothetical protein
MVILWLFSIFTPNLVSCIKNSGSPGYDSTFNVIDLIVIVIILVIVIMVK